MHNIRTLLTIVSCRWLVDEKIMANASDPRVLADKDVKATVVVLWNILRAVLLRGLGTYVINVFVCVFLYRMCICVCVFVCGYDVYVYAHMCHGRRAVEHSARCAAAGTRYVPSTTRFTTNDLIFFPFFDLALLYTIRHSRRRRRGAFVP